MTKAGWMLLVGGVVVACKTERVPEAPPSPSASSASKVVEVPPVDASAWKDDRPHAWTDARVVAALAADCDFVPPMGEHHPGGHSSDPLTCTASFEQTCWPDPCLADVDECRSTCQTTCEDCGKTCATSCRACKDKCSDASCKKTCAETCASCKQECVRTLDRCSTGKCAGEESCRTMIKDVAKKSSCAGRCATFNACTNKCNFEDACIERCKKPLARSVETCQERCEDAACKRKCLEAGGCSPELCVAVGN